MTAPEAPILVVDDNESNRLLVAAVLRAVGRRVLLAGDGAEGLAAILREKPALVILDLMMPGMDGAEVLRRLREEPGAPAPRVLLMTASSPEESARRARELAVDGDVPKPFVPARLRARVLELLSGGREP